jgi:hypothetical protein
MFVTYAIGYWYGGELVAKAAETHCIPRGITDTDCMTGGVITTVFLSVIFGSMSLGQVASTVAPAPSL